MILVLFQVIGGSLIVLVGLPAIMFPRLEIDDQDQWMGRAALMLAWLMVVGYVLASIRFFSAVALLVLVAATTWIVRRRARSRYELSGGALVGASLYDFLSHTFSWRRTAADQAETFSRSLPNGWLPRRPGTYVWMSLTFLVLGVAAWMRIGPNWNHAGMYFSDAYETLQWVKGIIDSSLFPNGIYPMGYYIVMAEIKSLMHANGIMFVKFFGGFVGMLLTGSVMWSTYRFSGRAVPALAAGTIYGLLPHLMPYTGVRQIAAEGQEFGNMLVLPVAWLVFQSWVTKKPGYVLAASALLTAIGLTHPLALLNAALAAIAATVGGWAVSGISGPILKRYLWMVPTAAVVVIAPLLIAYLAGVPLISTGVNFVNTSGGPVHPAIALMVWVALGGIFILFVTKLLWYDDLWEMGLPATAFLILGLAEAVVQLPRIGINTAALTLRAGEFLALAEAFSIGMGVAGVQEALERLGVRRSLAASGVLAASALSLGFLLQRVPPAPFTAYTLSPADFIVEYVRIEETLPRYSWLSVDYNGYALALNDAYQYNPDFWTAHVSPNTRWPRFHGLSAKPYPVSQRYVFFFVLHHVPSSDFLSGKTPFYSQRFPENNLTRRWVKAWESRFGPMPIYYQSRDLTIYRLTNPSIPI